MHSRSRKDAMSSPTPAPPPTRPPAGSRQGPATAVLFWIMLLVGGGSLAACLIVPAWEDHRIAKEQVAAARARNAALARESAARALQIEHHRRDPEYNESYVREQFDLRTPGVQTILVELPEPSADSVETAAPSQADQLTARVAQTVRGNAILSVFVLDQTRPGLIALSSALLIGALFLLPGSARSPR